MVAQQREDLPEPDRPVNTTRLSRGMATSTFLRLCSRAPRMVIWRASRAILLLPAAIGLAQGTVNSRVGAESPIRTRQTTGPVRASTTEHRKNASLPPEPNPADQAIKSPFAQGFHNGPKKQKPRALARGFGCIVGALEVVVHAAAENMDPDVAGERLAQGADPGHGRRSAQRGAAQIHIKIFRLGGPVAPQRCLRAATDCPAALVVTHRGGGHCSSKEVGKSFLHMGVGEAAGEIEKRRTGCVASA